MPSPSRQRRMAVVGSRSVGKLQQGALVSAPTTPTPPPANPHSFQASHRSPSSLWTATLSKATIRPSRILSVGSLNTKIRIMQQKSLTLPARYVGHFCRIPRGSLCVINHSRPALSLHRTSTVSSTPSTSLASMATCWSIQWRRSNHLR